MSDNAPQQAPGADAELARARHVFVIGNAGSGKSTLAGRWGEQLGRPLLALDHFAFRRGTSERLPVAESLDQVNASLGTRRHIVEGCYADLVGALSNEQDHLVWLDLPVATCVEHAQGRQWEPDKWPTKAAQDAFLPRLIEFITGYPHDTGPTGRPAHAALYEAFAGTRDRRTQR